jgi:hypothetical protein
LAADTKEVIPPEIESLLSSDSFTQATIHALEDPNDPLQKVKIDREWQISGLKLELDELYHLTAVDIRERKCFQSTPSAATIADLQQEVNSWAQEKDARLASLAAGAEEESICLLNSLALPEWKRPRCRGGSRDGPIVLSAIDGHENSHAIIRTEFDNMDVQALQASQQRTVARSAVIAGLEHDATALPPDSQSLSGSGFHFDCRTAALVSMSAILTSMATVGASNIPALLRDFAVCGWRGVGTR